jgi:hypothetical protein
LGAIVACEWVRGSGRVMRTRQQVSWTDKEPGQGEEIWKQVVVIVMGGKGEV